MSLAIFFSFYGKVSGAGLTHASQICPCLELSFPDSPMRGFIKMEGFLKYFPDADIPEEIDRSERSPYLNIGPYVVLQKLIRDSNLREILDEYMDEKNTGFLLDLACYSIIEENNAGQYYPDYAYEHALFTPDMKIYIDSKVSDFFEN